MKSLTIVFALCSLHFTTASLWAEGHSIRGVVTDAKGKPVAGAEIRADNTDAKRPPVVATTDAKGQYVLTGLPVGTYKLTASLYKTPKSVAVVKTTASWATVNFALKDPFQKQHVDQSAMDRIQGQDLRRMQQDQAFGH